MATKMKMNWGAFLLSLIGALIYLYVIWNVWGAMPAWLSAQPAAAGAGGAMVPTLPSVIQAILFGVAVVGAISFLLVTLGKTMMQNEMMSNWSMKVHFIAGLALIALSVPPAPVMWFWIVVIGFVLAELGDSMSMM